MFRILAAATVGLGLAISPIATDPAEALDGSTAAGIAAILGLGAVFAQNGNVDIQIIQGRDHRGYGDTRGHGLSRILPRNCMVTVETRRGGYSVFGQRCLARSGVNLRHLPRRCAAELRVGARISHGYEARCLQHNGWRVARHRY